MNETESKIEYNRFNETDTSRHIADKVRMVDQGRGRISRDNWGVLSTGEQCAVALVLNRIELCPKASVRHCSHNITSVSAEVRETCVHPDTHTDRVFYDGGGSYIPLEVCNRCHQPHKRPWDPM